VGVRAQRDLLGRVVRYLVGEAGLRQLLDIGSGLPTAENVHEIAHRIDPATRVVYLDNDPVVLAHAQALLADDKVTFAVSGDLRDPAGLLADPGVREHLDWDQPVGLLLCGILHYILDEEKPAQVVETLYRALPRAATSSSTTCWTARIPRQPPCRRRCKRASAGRSSGRSRRSGSCSTGWSWLSPASCSCPAGARIPAPPACSIIQSSAWPQPGWPARRETGSFGPGRAQDATAIWMIRTTTRVIAIAM
jgi:S-adenosyl methyltransferase